MSSPSTASGLLALEGASSAPAVHSASSQPTEGPLFQLPTEPAGHLGTGPTALTLSQGLQPSGRAILGWPGGPWHTGPAQEIVSQDYCEEGDSLQDAHAERGQDLGLSIQGLWCHSAMDSDHPVTLALQGEKLRP